MLVKNFIFRRLIVLALLPASGFGCGRQNNATSGSKLDSVEIDQTSVKDQYRVGFCWAYATMGLIESKHKMQTGESIDLSEEALAFYRMAESLVTSGQAYRRGNIALSTAVARATSRTNMEGWFVRAHTGSRDAMELIDTYGVVPEDQWSFKFKSEAQMDQLLAAVAPRFKQLLASNVAITVDSVSNVLVARNAFPSPPPRHVRFRGKLMTATELARSALRFHSSDYVSVSSSNGAKTNQLLGAIKRTMAAGISVPLSLVFDTRRLQNGVLRSANGFSSNAGGHAVLVTDFVNHGGHEGAMPRSHLVQEVSKGIEHLKYLKFKNSWGVSARQNEAGVPVTSGSGGYYYMEQDYFQDAGAYGHLSAVVPREIAANPLGSIVVNPNVAKEI